MKTIFLFAISLASTLSSLAQESPKEVCSQFLSILSGTPDKERDWDYINAHLTEDAKFAASNNGKVQNFSGKQFLEIIKKNASSAPFYEIPVLDSEFVFKNIAEVKQAYYVYTVDESKKLFGVNMYHLVLQEGVWKIKTIFWENSPNEGDLPKKL